VLLPAGATQYPGIEALFPAAARMQRAIHDLNGLRSSDPDTRPWLRHAAWPADAFPLAAESMPPSPQEPVDDYAFVRVDGDGVHEIAVGPVHAGIIEPGHFRFSVVGEKVLRLEERLGYVQRASSAVLPNCPCSTDTVRGALATGGFSRLLRALSAHGGQWCPLVHLPTCTRAGAERQPPRRPGARQLPASRSGSQFLRLKERSRTNEQALGQFTC
jgi:hypothetical protein